MWISPLIYGASAALGVYGAALLAVKTAQAVKNVIDAMSGNLTFMNTVAQYGLNAALLACPITWVVGGIIAGAAVLVAFCAWLAQRILEGINCRTNRDFRWLGDCFII